MYCRNPRFLENDDLPAALVFSLSLLPKIIPIKGKRLSIHRGGIMSLGQSISYAASEYYEGTNGDDDIVDDDTNWRTCRYRVQTDGTSSKLAFRGATGRGEGALLDDVRL